MATPVIKIQSYVGTKELKEAIKSYANAIGKPIQEIIADTWWSMLSSGDFEIDTLYEASIDTGLDRRENQAKRCFKLSMPPDLVERVDNVIADLKNRNNLPGINRSSFTQEAIRRYLEPELIHKGYLTISQFKNKHQAANNKRQAANNLVYFRESLGLTRLEFLAKYFTVKDKPLISYPQYTVIERSGKGNIDRLLKILSAILNIDKEVFYYSTEAFTDRLP